MCPDGFAYYLIIPTRWCILSGAGRKKSFHSPSDEKWMKTEERASFWASCVHNCRWENEKRKKRNKSNEHRAEIISLLQNRAHGVISKVISVFRVFSISRCCLLSFLFSCCGEGGHRLYFSLLPSLQFSFSWYRRRNLILELTTLAERWRGGIKVPGPRLESR